MSWVKTENESLEAIYHHKGYADMTMLRRFVDANGFNRMHGYQSGENIHSILKNGGFYGRVFSHDNNPPYVDHTQFFKNSMTGVCCLTYNPYKNADVIRDEVVQWAVANGLGAEVYSSEHSWYYPGHTSFVVIHLPGDKILLD